MPDGPVGKPGERSPDMGAPEEREPPKEEKPRSAVTKKAIDFAFAVALVCLGVPTLLVTLALVGGGFTETVGPVILAMVGWFGTYYVARRAMPSVSPLGCLALAVLWVGFSWTVLAPGLIRPRISANESATQGDIRLIVSANAAYEGSSGGNGYARDPKCLSTPSSATCIPGYPATAPTFLDARLAQVNLTKSGYARTYVPSPTARGVGASRFCYKAQPVVLNRTGTRSFGGDSSGVLAGTQGIVNCCREDGTLDAAVCPALY